MPRCGTSIIDYCNIQGGQVLVQAILKQYTGIDENGNKYSPYELTYGSNKELYWKCDAGHLRLQRVATRVKYPYAKCPICEQARLKQLTLKDWCKTHNFGSTIQQEWTGITKDGRHLDFNSLQYYDDTIVQWTCSNGHSWYRDIFSRVSEQHKCAVCSEMYRAAKPEYSLETFIRENKVQDQYVGVYGIEGVKPRDIWYRSHLRTIWRCKSGHVYNVDTYKKVMENYGCPCCKQSAIWGDRSLVNWCNNNGVQGQSVRMAWTGKCENGTVKDINKTYTFDSSILTWKCINNHLYKASVKDIVYNHTKCPMCSMKYGSEQFKQLSNTLHKLLGTLNCNITLNCNDNPDKRLFVDFFVKEYNTAINYVPSYWSNYNEYQLRNKLNRDNIRLLTIKENAFGSFEVRFGNSVETYANLDSNTVEKIVDTIKRT